MPQNTYRDDLGPAADVYNNMYSRMDSNALGSLSTTAPLMYTVDIQFLPNMTSISRHWHLNALQIKV